LCCHCYPLNVDWRDRRMRLVMARPGR
jgi:hypothetical protein